MMIDSSREDTSAADPVRVGIGEIAVTDEDVALKSYGLGSCLAVALYDSEAGVAGLAHVMLPEAGTKVDRDELPGKYADTAIDELLRRMSRLGGDPANVDARIAGGSDMFEFDSLGDSVGVRNVAAVRERLRQLSIPVVTAEVGGHAGRIVTFDAATGELSIDTAASGDGVSGP